MKNQEFEKLVFETGSELLKQSQSKDSFFSGKNWWYKKMLSWTMRHPTFKTNLFRFVDVLPSLSRPEQILAYFKEYLKDQDLGLMTSGLGKLAPSLIAKQITNQIRQVAKMFITGDNPLEALKVISQNWNDNFAFSMDILGEATLSEKEAEMYFQKYLSLMDDLTQASLKWPKKELLQKDSSGEIPKVNLSVKASSLFSQIKPEAWEYSKDQLKKRLRPLFQKAVKNFVFINLDMEHYHFKDLFLEIFKELIREEELKNYPHFGIVIQTYLKDSFDDLKALSELAKERKAPITVRLVKGAYWDSEVLLARQKNWPIPVYTEKSATDANFERCVKWLFEKSSSLKVAIGSHNIRSIAYALTLHKKHPQIPLEFQILYGMAEGLAKALRDQNSCVRIYCTIGELIPGMSYFVRRLLENSANQSFIFSSFVKNQSPETLLAPPTASLDSLKFEIYKHGVETEAPQSLSKVFKNHPLMDFSQKENREYFTEALQTWKTQFPVKIPIILEGKGYKSPHLFKRVNPSQRNQTISHSFFATIEQMEKATQYTSDFFKTWSRSCPQKRISYLKKLANLMQKKEFELASLQVFEVGKTWVEAQADVAEAIDFCNYYALSYEKLMERKKTDEVSGEESFLQREAIGPAAVIAPWNFPLAILTGMTVAPLVCGNTVIIKPAEQSPLTALQLAKMLLESGFPKQSFAFLTGKGEETGDYLVNHPKVSIVSFTGSFEVGSQILKKVSHITKKQKDIKKGLLEMGGKNAIVVDSCADLDEAISGILSSAFGFQGQKCSACSRVIVLEDVYDLFLERFLPAVQSLVVGPPENPESSIGPLIDASSFERIHNFSSDTNSIKLFEGDVKHLTEGHKTWFVPPRVYLTDQEHSHLMQDELFAPILALFKVKNLDEAIKQTNAVRFGLTAAFYSRHPEHIEKFKSLVEVGNLYINRNCTGAVVKRHPFGGRKMSGLGSKTGGAEYLKQFLHTKTVTENMMRRGFAPEIFEENF